MVRPSRSVLPSQLAAVAALLTGRDVLTALPASLAGPGCLDVLARHATAPVTLVAGRESLSEHAERLTAMGVPHAVAPIDGPEGSRDGNDGHDDDVRVPWDHARIRLVRHEDVVGAVGEAVERATLIVIDDGERLDPGSPRNSGLPVAGWDHLRRARGARLVLAAGAASDALQRLKALLALRRPYAPPGPRVRPNLHLAVRRPTDALPRWRREALLRLLQDLERPGLVYCESPQEVDALHGWLRTHRIPVHRDHDGMAPNERSQERLQFLLPGRRTVLLQPMPSYVEAPDAFARGASLAPAQVRKRDLRFVIHYRPPPSLSAYLDEIDVVGLDGAAAHSFLLADPGDAARVDRWLQQHLPEEHSLAAVVDQLASSGRVTLQGLARRVQRSRAELRRCLTLLREFGLVDVRHGTVSRREPLDGASVLDALERRRREEARRLAEVMTFVRWEGCRVALLEAGGPRDLADRCGRCDGCARPPGERQDRTAHAPSPPRRRRPARRIVAGTDAAPSPPRRRRVG